MLNLRPRTVLLLAGLMFGLFASISGCGKRGPLYLPDETGAQTRTSEPAGSPAPAPTDKASGEDAHQK